MIAVQTTAHHASAYGALIVPALVMLMVAPFAVARVFFGVGDTDGR